MSKRVERLSKCPDNRKIGFVQSGKTQQLDWQCETQLDDGLPVFRETFNHEVDMAPSPFGHSRTPGPQQPASIFCAQGIPGMSHIVAPGGEESRGGKNIVDSQIPQMARAMNEINISNIRMR
jgi:hypothetical protein